MVRLSLQREYICYDVVSLSCIWTWACRWWMENQAKRDVNYSSNLMTRIWLRGDWVWRQQWTDNYEFNIHSRLSKFIWNAQRQGKTSRCFSKLAVHPRRAWFEILLLLYLYQQYEEIRRRLSKQTLLAWVDLVILGISALKKKELSIFCLPNSTPEREKKMFEKMMSHLINSFRCSMINEVQELWKLFIALPCWWHWRYFMMSSLSHFDYRSNVVCLCAMRFTTKKLDLKSSQNESQKIYIEKILEMNDESIRDFPKDHKNVNNIILMFIPTIL